MSNFNILENNKIINFLNSYNAKNKELIQSSLNNNYKISCALITKEITSLEYKFKLAIINRENYKIISRSVYELENNNIVLNKSTWDNDKQEYIYIVKRTNDQKIIAFSLEIQDPNTGEIVSIISDHYLIREKFENIYPSIEIKPNNQSRSSEILKLNINNFKYSNGIKIIWQKKYKSGMDEYCDIEVTNYEQEKLFNKEITGKYIRAKIMESIQAPIGLFINGKVKTTEFITGLKFTNEIYIHPGIFSGYKLVGSLLKENKILLLPEFKANSSQKEIDFKIAWWESKTNDNKWIKYNTQSKRMIFPYSKIDKVEFRFAYFLKTGTKYDALYSNILTFDSLEKETKILKSDNKLIIYIPQYVNKYEVQYQWYVKYKNEINFSLIKNNDKNILDLNNNINSMNATYKAILNYRDLFINYELQPITLDSDLVDDNIEIIKVASFDDLINVKVISSLNCEEKMHYIWGEGDKIIESKTGDSTSFYRSDCEKEYWVYISYGNKMTKKQYFKITEAFKPNIEFIITWPLVTINIKNKNIDKNFLIFNWQKSIDGNKWEDILTLNKDTIDLSKENITFGYLRAKLKYKEINDFVFSQKIKINN